MKEKTIYAWKVCYIKPNGSKISCCGCVLTKSKYPGYILTYNFKKWTKKHKNKGPLFVFKKRRNARYFKEFLYNPFNKFEDIRFGIYKCKIIPYKEEFISLDKEEFIPLGKLMLGTIFAEKVMLLKGEHE